MKEKSNWLDIFEKQYRLIFFGKNIQMQYENVSYFSHCIDKKIVIEIDQDKKQISMKKDNCFRNDHQDELIKYLLVNSNRWDQIGLKKIDKSLRIINIESNDYFTIYSFDTIKIH